MWVFGRGELKLSEEEFWNMTPGQYDLLARWHLKREEAKEERLDYRAALICSVIANVNRDSKKKSKPFQPQDFMPKKQVVKKRQTPEDMLEVVKALNAAFGGTTLC